MEAIEYCTTCLDEAAMLRLSQSGRARATSFAHNSPLTRLDPRVKLAMSLGASLAVMLPLDRLIIFSVFYTLLMAWGRLLPMMLRQVWQIKWILAILFALDWWLIGPNLAIIITLRLILLAGTFSLLFGTTTASQFGLALESLGLPYRFTFSLSLAFQSLSLLDEEWRSIREAQTSRGIQIQFKSWRDIFRNIGELVSLTVPAIVLTTRRAWALTESAHARGFDSPCRQAYTTLTMKTRDWLVLIATAITIILIFWR